MKKLIILLTVLFFIMAGVTYAQTVDPKDLKNSDPKPPSLKINPPPPLPEKEKTPIEKIDQISEFARYNIPDGWTEENELNQGDVQAGLERDLHRIKIRLSGGEASRYKTPGDFLAGFEARSFGNPPEKVGEIIISGLSLWVYKREIAVRLPPPETRGPTQKTKEEFCVVPAGERFFILSYSYGDSILDLYYNGREVWREFLKRFKLIEKRAGGK